MKIKLKSFLLLLILIFVMSSLAYAEDDTLKSNSSIAQQYGFSIEEEKEIGLQSALLMIKRFSLYENPSVVAYVREVGDKLAKKISKRPEIKYQFFVLNSNQINAYAVPGGYIFITKGLLKSLENEAELAGVISHEISHVELGHGLYAISSNPETRAKIRIIKTNIEEGNALIQQSSKKFVENEKDLSTGIVNSGSLKRVPESIETDENGNLVITPN